MTGGGTGIGLAIAQGLAEAGARVVIAERREQPLREASAKLGNGCAAYAFDVADMAGIPAAVNAIAERFGALNIRAFLDAVR